MVVHCRDHFQRLQYSFPNKYEVGVCCRKWINPWAGIPNSEIRASLEQQWKDELVWNDTAEGYLLLDDKIHRRKFCICPHGFPTNTVLIADSIRYGCIPGTIQNMPNLNSNIYRTCQIFYLVFFFWFFVFYFQN
jgi:hypothetical protein